MGEVAPEQQPPYNPEILENPIEFFFKDKISRVILMFQ
jgi:hypothetical protein